MALTNIQELEVKRQVDLAKQELEKNYLSYDKLKEMTGFQTDMIKVLHNSVAKGTTIPELAYFLTYCKGVGLNPLNKEIWCYKNSKGDVLIFTGRDGFLKKNKENPLYRGMRSSEVCEYDDFEMDMITGDIRHKITNNRGPLIGAYAIVYVEGQKDTMVYLDFAEFDLKQAKWKDAPKMMIKKCAQSQALKEASGMTGIQAEEAFVVKDGVAYAEFKQEKVEPEEDRLLKMIDAAKTVEQLSKFMKECTTPELINIYDLKKKELEGK